jgi:hypothetical protein
MLWLVNNKPKDQKMIKIEFPADRSDIALAIGRALIVIGQAEGLDGGQVKTSLGTDTRTDQEKTEERSELYKHTAEPKAGEVHTRGDSHGTYEHVGEIGAAIKEVLSQEQRVDEKLVVFDAKYCGEAAVPFYASGKRKGQWKKRKSVEEVDYDEWYALEQESDEPVQQKTDEPAPDHDKAANAFKKSPVVDAKAPENFGELMAWFSTQQTAGNYEAHHLEQAFKTLKLSTLDLVQDTTGEKVAQVYEYLA